MNPLNKIFITISLFIALFNSVNYNADIDTLKPSMFNQVVVYSDPLEPSSYNQIAVYIDPLEPSIYNQVALYNDPLKPSLYNQVMVYTDPLQPTMNNQVAIYKEEAPLYVPFVIDTGVISNTLDECSINGGPLFSSSYIISLLVLISGRIFFKFIKEISSSPAVKNNDKGLFINSRINQKRMVQRIKKRFNSRYNNNR